jgi:beta-N-acetylhexosaminidase
MNLTMNQKFDRRDHIKPVIFGCEGLELTSREMELFGKHNPLGFIVFSRNIDNPQQLRKLVMQMKACVFPRNDVLIMIDQEGGRVARLKPPFWPSMPAAHSFTEMIPLETLPRVKKLVYNNFRLCSYELRKLGINVNCAPMLDVLFPNSDDIIGDRSFSSDTYEITEMAKEVCEGLLMGNVFPVIKHIPGHGRATADSHKELPVVEASIDQLRNTDFVPFKALKDMPFAMTAHIKYLAIDPDDCATQSIKVIDYIRNDIGFKGILFSDDLAMNALKGTMKERTRKSISAGCDAVLHCNGNYEEMLEIVESIEVWNDETRERFRDCWKHLRY